MQKANKKQAKNKQSEPDILDLAGKYKFKKVMSALKVRELFEKNYDGRF